MDWTTAEGNSYEEAVDSLLKSLGADKSEVEIEDLGEQRKMFGFGGVVTRVRGRFRVESFRDESPRRRPGKPEKEHSAKATEHPAKANASPSQLSEMEEKGCVFLTEILARMGIDDARVTPSTDGSVITLNIESGSGGLIIGRAGETLEALQTLLEIYASRLNEGLTKMIVDTENYRSRREDKLRELALKAAEEAVVKGKKVYLGNMKSSERKLIHTVLQDNTKVQTRSQGSGETRQVVVYPAR